MKFLASVSIYVFISTTTTSLHKDNLRAERIGNSDPQFFLYALVRHLVHACTIVVKKHAPWDNFFKNDEPNRVSEMSLSYSQNRPIYFPSGKHKVSICSFLVYCYMTVFVYDISYSSKGCLVYDCAWNVQRNAQPWSRQ